jgi:hypothetical protein
MVNRVVKQDHIFYKRHIWSDQIFVVHKGVRAQIKRHTLSACAVMVRQYETKEGWRGGLHTYTHRTGQYTVDDFSLNPILCKKDQPW